MVFYTLTKHQVIYLKSLLQGRPSVKENSYFNSVLTPLKYLSLTMWISWNAWLNKLAQVQLALCNILYNTVWIWLFIKQYIKLLLLSALHWLPLQKVYILLVVCLELNGCLIQLQWCLSPNTLHLYSQAGLDPKGNHKLAGTECALRCSI